MKIFSQFHLFLVLAGAVLAQDPTPFLPQPVELRSPDTPRTHFFGVATDLSADGRTALVGAIPNSCSTNEDCAAAYIFVQGPEGWALEARLLPSDPVQSDAIGSMALSEAGDIALVGVRGAGCDAGPDCGAVYAFVKGPGGWSELQKLEASDEGIRFFFGSGVAMTPDSGVVLVGAIGATCGAIASCGAVYVFERSGGTWVERQKLTPSDPYFQSFFGSDLALSGDGGTALIGGNRGGGLIPGSVYVFTRTGSVWAQETRIEPPGLFFEFGLLDVSDDGGTAIIQGHPLGAGFNDPGVASIFIREPGGWTLQDQFPAGPRGGVALSPDGSLAVVSFINSPCPGCGSVGVRRRNGDDWEEIQRLTTPSVANELALASLAFSANGRTILLGLPNAGCPARPDCGAAFVFAAAPAGAEIPTLGELGLILLALFLAASGAALLGRRRRSC